MSLPNISFREDMEEALFKLATLGTDEESSDGLSLSSAIELFELCFGFDYDWDWQVGESYYDLNELQAVFRVGRAMEPILEKHRDATDAYLLSLGEWDEVRRLAKSALQLLRKNDELNES